MKAETIQAAKANLELNKTTGRYAITDAGIREICRIEGIREAREFKKLWLNRIAQQLLDFELSTPANSKIQAAIDAA